MNRLTLTIASLLLGLSYTTQAIACLGPMMHERTLLETLPSTAKEQELVAKVKIIAANATELHNPKLTTSVNSGTGKETKSIDGSYGFYVGLEVVEGIKNTKAGDEILSRRQRPSPSDLDTLCTLHWHFKNKRT